LFLAVSFLFPSRFSTGCGACGKGHFCGATSVLSL
jgi:hypothetical protein